MKLHVLQVEICECRDGEVSGSKRACVCDGGGGDGKGRALSRLCMLIFSFSVFGKCSRRSFSA